MDNWKNKLFFGDNLGIIREHIKDETIDLIYLDPPFNSKATYNVLFEEKDGKQSTAQITAFDDTWHWGAESVATFKEITQTAPKKTADLLKALSKALGTNDMLAYLVNMTIRLLELKRILKPSGSLYLHCDPTASHYLKVVMDSIFGAQFFRNEIIWKRQSAHSDSIRYGSVHDVILFYSKSDKYTWNKIYQPYDDDYINQYYRYKDKDGRKFMSGDLGAAGLQGGGYNYEWKGITRLWRVPPETMQRLEDEGSLFYTRNGIPRIKRYLDEAKGIPVQDVWADLESLRSWHKERLGYQTQKPEALLERILNASSNPGDLVFDPFCGCGTTVSVAERLKRRWIGIDITHLAVALMENRLKTGFQKEELAPYNVIGVPVDVESAKALALENRFEFEYWALSLVSARPANDKKKGGDKGIDGYIYFYDENDFDNVKTIIVQVKSGKVGPEMIRELKTVVSDNEAVIGAFITLEPPTKGMVRAAEQSGLYTPEHFPAVPKIQILTIKELLLDGKNLNYYQVPATFKSAQRKYKNEPKQDTFI